MIFAMTIVAWVLDHWARHPEKMPARKQKDRVLRFLFSRGFTTATAGSLTALSLAVLLAVATGWKPPTGWVLAAAIVFVVIGTGLGLASATILAWRRPRFLIPYAQRTEAERGGAGSRRVRGREPGRGLALPEGRVE